MNTDDIYRPTVASVRAHTLTGVVQYEIERMILSGELVAGERLNEKAVADKLSVSRGPIREACRALAELGLIHLIPNRGAFIRRLTRADAVEVFDLRAGLTALAASLVAPALTQESLAHLESMVDEMDVAAQNSDFATFHSINLAFHDYIVRASANNRLIKVYSGLVKEFHLFRSHGPTQGTMLAQSNREHREILAALRSKDAASSYEVSFRHVNSGKQRMLAVLDGLAQAAPAPDEQY